MPSSYPPIVLVFADIYFLNNLISLFCIRHRGCPYLFGDFQRCTHRIGCIPDRPADNQIIGAVFDGTSTTAPVSVVPLGDVNGDGIDDFAYGSEGTSSVVQIFFGGSALDTTADVMYWAEEGSGTIWRAGLDGTNAEELLAGLGSPFGIALDPAAGKIYWTDDGSDKLQSADLDGSNVEDVITDIPSLRGVAVAPRLSADCNTNGIPDTCETFPDCNLNAVPDECELGGNDCNANGVPDECDVDCDTNGTPDACESFADCNSNSIPDACELSGNDCNSGDQIVKPHIAAGTSRSLTAVEVAVGLRLAHALLKGDPESEVSVFLLADAVVAARRGQKTPDGYYNMKRMLKRDLGRRRELLKAVAHLGADTGAAASSRVPVTLCGKRIFSDL